MKPTTRFNSLAPTQDNIQQQINNLTRILAGNVSFGSTIGNTDGEQNLEIWKTSGTTPGVADTEFTVAHGLGRIPFFYLYITDKAANIYQLPATGTAWTSTDIFLKCDVATVEFNMIIF